VLPLKSTYVTINFIFEVATMQKQDFEGYNPPVRESNYGQLAYA
jgi:hypothetical protein